MSLSRLLAEMDSREISEWMAYFQIESKKDETKSAEELKAKFASLTTTGKNGAKRNSKS